MAGTGRGPSRVSARRTAAKRRRPASARTRRRRARRGRAPKRSRGPLVIALLGAGAVAFGVSRIDFGEAIREITLPLEHEDIIREQAERFELDPALIAAIINQESGFADQTSSAGARGLMQITHDTADTIERLSGGETFTYDDLADPELNIRYGTYYFDYLMNMYAGNVVAALSAYNAGPGNADAWGGAAMEAGDIHFVETRAYVDDVLENREQYEANYAKELGID